MHRTHRRLGADQIHRRRVLESDRDDAGLLRRLRAAVHPLRLLPLDAQEAAQERRMAQFSEGRAGIHRSRAGHEVPLGGRPDLPLGTARPGDLPRRVDRDLLAAGSLPAG